MSNLSNPSGLLPRGRAVLVKPYEPQAVKSSVIAIPQSARERLEMVEQRAVVLDIGPSAWHDEPTPRAQIGDRVIFTKFAGYMAIGPADGEQYRLINDRDIFASITSKENGHG